MALGVLQKVTIDQVFKFYIDAIIEEATTHSQAIIALEAALSADEEMVGRLGNKSVLDLYKLLNNPGLVKMLRLNADSVRESGNQNAQNAEALAYIALKINEKVESLKYECAALAPLEVVATAEQLFALHLSSELYPVIVKPEISQKLITAVNTEELKRMIGRIDAVIKLIPKEVVVCHLMDMNEEEYNGAINLINVLKTGHTDDEISAFFEKNAVEMKELACKEGDLLDVAIQSSEIKIRKSPLWFVAKHPAAREQLVALEDERFACVASLLKEAEDDIHLKYFIDNNAKNIAALAELNAPQVKRFKQALGAVGMGGFQGDISQVKVLANIAEDELNNLRSALKWPNILRFINNHPKSIDLLISKGDERLERMDEVLSNKEVRTATNRYPGWIEGFMNLDAIKFAQITALMQYDEIRDMILKNPQCIMQLDKDVDKNLCRFIEIARENKFRIKNNPGQIFTYNLDVVLYEFLLGGVNRSHLFSTLLRNCTESEDSSIAAEVSGLLFKMGADPDSVTMEDGLSLRMSNIDFLKEEVIHNIFMDAVKDGDKKAIANLLKNFAVILLGDPKIKSGSYPLLRAVQEKREDIVKVLLDAGAVLKFPPDYEFSSNEELECTDFVRWLLAIGVDINAPDKRGDTLLVKAVGSKNSYFIKALLEAGASVKYDDENALAQLASSAFNQDISGVKALLKAGANPNFIKDQVVKDSLWLRECLTPGLVWEIFIDAVKDDDKKVINTLLKNFTVMLLGDPNISVKSTGLLVAVHGKREDVVKVLLDAGANVKYDEHSSNLLFNEALASGNVEIIKMLLYAGLDLKIPAPYKLSVTESLLNLGVDINALDKYGDTLLVKAIRSKDDDFAKALLKAGASVKFDDESALAQLSLSVSEGYGFGVVALLRAGANPNFIKDEVVKNSRWFNNIAVCIIFGSAVKDRDEKAIANLLKSFSVTLLGDPKMKVESYGLVSAAQEGRGDVVRVLLDAGANVKYDEHSSNLLFNEALASGNVEIIKMLLYAGLDIKLPGVYTLRCEPIVECKKLVQSLLNIGVDINAPDKHDNTLLVKAVASKDMYLAEALLKAGASVRYGDERALAQLALAVSENDRSSVEVLLRAGANPNFIKDEVIKNSFFFKDTEVISSYFANIENDSRMTTNLDEIFHGFHSGEITVKISYKKRCIEDIAADNAKRTKVEQVLGERRVVENNEIARGL